MLFEGLVTELRYLYIQQISWCLCQIYILEVRNLNSKLIPEFQSLQVSDTFEQAVGNQTPGVGKHLWHFFVLPSPSVSCVSAVHSRAQPAAQMSRMSLFTFVRLPLVRGTAHAATGYDFRNFLENSSIDRWSWSLCYISLIYFVY